MNLAWSREANQDVFRLSDFLIDKSPEAAFRFIRELRDHTSIITEQPRIGRPYKGNSKIRVYIMPFGSNGYVIRYGITDSDVIILRIWHQRETR